LKLEAQLGPEPLQVVVELVACLVSKLEAQLGPEPLQVVVELVSHLVLEPARLALDLDLQISDLSLQILEVGLDNGSGCLA
jgi:hypothetical protein